MKNHLVPKLAVLAASLILVSSYSSVNHSLKSSNESSHWLAADGSPLPPVPKPKNRIGVLVADGSPLPPVPKPKNRSILERDGSPLPPVPKPKNRMDALVADGSPLPPVPKPKHRSQLA